MTFSGFCVRDVYDALDVAFSVNDLDRCCSLAAELLCTPRESRALVGYLVALYAKHYVSCTNATATMRIADSLADVDASASRRGLCEAVILIACQRRKDGKLLCDLCEDVETSNAAEAALEAAGWTADALLTLVDPRAAVVAAGRLCNAPTSFGASAPEPPPGLVAAVALSGTPPPGRAVRRDVAWSVWQAAFERSGASSDVSGLLQSLLKLYCLRCTARRHRDDRLNLLYAAVYVAFKGRASVKPLSERVSGLVAKGVAAIDSVVDEILCQDKSHESKRHDDRDCTYSRYDDSEGSYLSRVTRYDDEARCAVADDKRRAACKTSSAIKSVTVSSRFTKLADA